MMKRRNLSMKPESKRTGLLCRGLLAGLFFWAGLGGTQGQTPGLTYPVPIDEEHFPDAVFRNIVDDYDEDGNGSLSVEECGNVTELSINHYYYEGLTSLEGIRYFYVLESLDCSYNFFCLTSLDVSGLTALTNLECDHNQLTSLDVSGLTALTSLRCNSNQLTSLDVSGLTALTNLECDHNQLTSLDVSGLTALTSLRCNSNQLTSLDVGGLPALTNLNCAYNQLTSLDLSSCTVLEAVSLEQGWVLVSSDDSNRFSLSGLIQERGGEMSMVENTRVDRSEYKDDIVQFFSPEASLSYRYETGKGGMDVTLRPASFNDYAVVAIDEEHFPDFNFRRYIQEHFDANRDEILNISEIFLTETVIHREDDFSLISPYIFFRTDVHLFEGIGLDVSDMGITDLTGIEYFKGLEVLVCQNNALETLDLTKFPELRSIDCSGNATLSRIELAEDSLLIVLDCNRTTLDLKQALPRWKNLAGLDCRGMQLMELDMSGNPRLSFVACSNNQIDTLSLAGTGIGSLYCGENGMRHIDFGGDTLHSLGVLECSFNRLTELDLSLAPDLADVGFLNNRLACMDFSQMYVYYIYHYEDNEDSTGNYHGVVLDGNRKMALSSIPGLDASRITYLRGGTIQGDSLTFVKDTVSYFYHYRSPNPDAPLGGYFSLYLMETEPVRIDEANFPDEVFRTYVSEHLDSSANGYLDGKEATIKALDVSGLGIRNLKGIGNFADLESLDCSDNQLSSLDLSLNTKLSELDATGNVLKVSLDDANRLELSALPGFDPAKASDWTGAQVENGQLQFLQAEVSYIYETGYQGGAELPEVRFYLDAGNGEAEIAVSEANFPDAVFRSHVSGQIDRSGNDSLDIVERGNVRTLEVADMGIQDLRGIGYFNKLENLDCSGNELTSLDLSGNPELQTLNAENNQLDITLDASNGFDLSLLPGFDLAKASGWEGGTRLGNILTFSQREVAYTYATGYSGSTEDESLPSVRFSLRADREPGVANESMEAKPQGKVYAKEHVIHTEGIEGEISVFTPSGMLLYQGHGKEIPVRNDGLYIVRSGQQVWKVLVM